MKLLGLFLSAMFCMSFMAQAQSPSPVSKMAGSQKPAFKADAQAAPPSIPSEQFHARKPAAAKKTKKK